MRGPAAPTRRSTPIVHFAAESHVDRSIAASAAFVETNVVGTHALLEAARCVWLERRRRRPRHRFHHVSTDEVYGSLGPDDPPFTESSLYRPNSPYAASKAAADHLVRAYHKTYGLRTTVSNCSNNYGPYQYPEKLIPLCIVNLLRGTRAADLRRREQRARLALRARITAPASSGSSSAAGSGRPTTSAATTSAPTSSW